MYLTGFFDEFSIVNHGRLNAAYSFIIAIQGRVKHEVVAYWSLKQFLCFHDVNGRAIFRAMFAAGVSCQSWDS